MPTSTESIFSFIGSFLASALITALVAVIYLFMTFDLAGGETLDVIEGQNIAMFIISLLLLSLAVWFAKVSFRKGRKQVAYGAILFPCLVFIAASVYLIDQNFNYTNFNKSTWQDATSKPEKMAKSLVKEKILIGLTRQQVKEMLGPGSSEYGNENGSIEYHVANDWTLTIIFEQNKVVETHLRQPFLGV